MRDGWTETTLDELVISGVISLGRGNVISKKDMEADPGPYPVYSSAQNNDGRIGSYNKFMFDEQLITWSVDGGGYVFYRPPHKFSVTNIGGYLRILDNTKFLYPFLAAVLQKLHGQHVFDWQNKAHPSVIRKLYNNIPLAPLAEQKRIVDVVSSVDAYIDALQQQVDTARTARNAVLHELLSAGGDDWSETTLGDVAVLNPKESALSADSPFIPMDAVHVGKRYIQYHEPRGDRNGARANTGDVLFARITPCLENGKVAQIQSGIERCGGSTEFIVIRGTNMFDSDFAYFWATWSETRNHAAGLMTGTTGRQRLSASDLGAMSVSLPPLVEQKRIVEIVSSMDEVIQSTEQAVTDAKNLRSGLLSDLLSGEHEIPASYDVFVGAA